LRYILAFQSNWSEAMATYKELQAQAQKLLEQAEELRKQETDQVIADIREKIKVYGLTAGDLGFGASKGGPKRAAKVSAPQASALYKGPNGEIWSGGRGRRPKWVVDALASGKSLEEFRAH
jgi:DNA-binding protein H-NS